MFKQLVLFMVLINSAISFAMHYDEDNSPTNFPHILLLGTLTCPTERFVRVITDKAVRARLPIDVITKEVAQQRESLSANLLKEFDKEIRTVLAFLRQFIEGHEHSRPNHFGLS